MWLPFIISVVISSHEDNVNRTAPAYNITCMSSFVNPDDSLELKLFEKLKTILIDKLGIEEAEVTMDASFTNDLGADSLDVIEILMEVEKEFNITIPDEEAEQLTTVKEA